MCISDVFMLRFYVYVSQCLFCCCGCFWFSVFLRVPHQMAEKNHVVDVISRTTGGAPVMEYHAGKSAQRSAVVENHDELEGESRPHTHILVLMPASV